MLCKMNVFYSFKGIENASTSYREYSKSSSVGDGSLGVIPLSKKYAIWVKHGPRKSCVIKKKRHFNFLTFYSAFITS